jgi:hypothetical protein
VIGAIGSLLGEKGINVDTLHVAHDEEKCVAMSMWSLSSTLDEDTLCALRKLPLVGTASMVCLD